MINDALLHEFLLGEQEVCRRSEETGQRVESTLYLEATWDLHRFYGAAVERWRQIRFRRRDPSALSSVSGVLNLAL